MPYGLGVQVSPCAPIMSALFQEKNIHRLFVVSLFCKAANAFIQIVLGIFLLCTTEVASTVLMLAKNELIEDPDDFISSHVIGLISHVPPSTQMFGALYLLSHGVIKGFLVWGLIKNKLWAYPASLGVFSLFIVYQLIRFASTHSVFLILLTIFDILVIVLVWHEYRFLVRKRHTSIE